ncbi:MAG: hypothetical protein KAS39_01240, partial [Actinomycetia bacterium]|nr:hypothetical protein [Actinomycetes bacterium]
REYEGTFESENLSARMKRLEDLLKNHLAGIPTSKKQSASDIRKALGITKEDEAAARKAIAKVNGGEPLEGEDSEG